MLKLSKLLLLTSVALSCVQEGVLGMENEGDFIPHPKAYKNVTLLKEGGFVEIEGSEKPIKLKGIDRIKETIEKKLEKELSKYPELRNSSDIESVILMGRTGNGKSTSMNLLAGRTFVAEVANDGKLRVSASDEVSHIGHGVLSDTTAPVPWYHTGNNILFWDCPGFDDTRGTVIEINNAFAIRELCRPKTKFVLLTTDEELGYNRGGEFVKLLSDINEMFQDNSHLDKGLSVIVNKHLPSNFYDISRYLRSLAQGALSSTGRKLLINLSQHPECIASLPPASAPGPYAPPLSPVWNAIKASAYITPINPVIRLSDTAKREINDWARDLNDSIYNYMQGIGQTHIINHCKSLIETHTGNVGALRDRFSKLITDVERLQFTKDTSSPKSFTNGLLKIFGEGLFDIKGINKTIGLIEFLNRNIDPNAQCDVARWRSTLSHIRRDIEELTNTGSINIVNDELIIKGILLGISDINKHINNQNQVKKVNVFALNTLFFDENFSKSGCSLNLIAPTWKVVNGSGKKIIDISGLPGARGVDGAHYGPGAHGQPGGHGGNGGNFYGIGESFVSFNNSFDALVINLNGGNGGDGGSGAQGAPGTPGSNGNPYLCTSVTHDHTWTHKSEKLSGKIQTFRCRLEHYCAPGEPGKQGQNGGQGGIGGVGGYPGKFTPMGLILNSEPLKPTYAFCGINGANGSFGQGGIGGADGQDSNGRKRTQVHYWTHVSIGHGRKHWHAEAGYHRRTKCDETDVRFLPGHHANKTSKAVDGQPGQGVNVAGRQGLPENPKDNPLERKQARDDYRNYLFNAREKSKASQSKAEFFIKYLPQHVLAETKNNLGVPGRNLRNSPWQTSSLSETSTFVAGTTQFTHDSQEGAGSSNPAMPEPRFATRTPYYHYNPAYGNQSAQAAQPSTPLNQSVAARGNFSYRNPPQGVSSSNRGTIPGTAPAHPFTHIDQQNRATPISSSQGEPQRTLVANLRSRFEQK